MKLDEFTREILKYYCSEKNIPLDESLADTEEFENYVRMFAERARKNSELKIKEYENKLVTLVKEVVDELRQGHPVLVETRKGQRKGFLKSIRSYLKATEGHDSWVNQYLKVREK